MKKHVCLSLMLVLIQSVIPDNADSQDRRVEHGFRSVSPSSIPAPVGTAAELEAIEQDSPFQGIPELKNSLSWELLNSDQVWGRLSIVGIIGESTIPAPVLRTVGQQKANPGGQLAALFGGLWTANPPKQPLISRSHRLSPWDFERALQHRAHQIPMSVGDNLLILRYDEIFLPSQEDTDRRHVHRTIYLKTNAKAEPTVQGLLTSLADRDQAYWERQIEAISEYSFTAICSHDRRVRFVKQATHPD